jgi:hypothetical protein
MNHYLGLYVLPTLKKSAELIFTASFIVALRAFPKVKYFCAVEIVPGLICLASFFI